MQKKNVKKQKYLRYMFEERNENKAQIKEFSNKGNKLCAVVQKTGDSIICKRD